MKKIISLTLVFLIVTTCLIGCSSNYNTADDGRPYDSLNLSNEELNQVRDKYTDKSNQTIIKFYMGTRLHRFEFGDGIKEIWNIPPEPSLPWCYVVVNNSEEITKTIAGGAEWSTNYDELFLYALNTDKVFDSDVEVQNVYCFSEFITSVDSSVPEEVTPHSTYLFDPAMPFVYFVTDKGDFVLCRLENKGDIYFFPLEDFKEYVHAIYVEDGVAERAEEFDKIYGDAILYGANSKYVFTQLIPTKAVFDLTPYIFTEKT